MRSFENPRWGPGAAALLPLLVYACTASGHDYWLDSGEFVAAAIDLDIAHPPGHPLAQLWAKPFTLLPVGPLPYRAAIAQSAAAALALAFVQTAFARSLARVHELAIATRTWLSVGAAWVVGGSYAFWFQAVRAEVYALEALLVCIALERLLKLACSDADERDPRPLYLACLALGLGLANHHFIAVLSLPALLVELVLLVRARGGRVFWISLLAGASGLVTYAYLPLRALRTPPMDWGHPTSFSDFFWVVSARVYARRIGSEALQPTGERFADLVILIVENFSAVALPLALLGAYALARVPHTRRLGYVWTITALVSLCGRAYLNPVRANPDVLGYMMPGFAALIALALCALVMALRLSSQRMEPLFAQRGAALFAGLFALLGILQFGREVSRSSLADFQAPTHFDDLRRRGLAPHALVVLTTPDAIFRHFGGEAVERLRADLTVLPVPFLGYGSTHEVLLRRHPELAPVVADYLHRGELSCAALRELASTRPVYLELDTRVSLGCYGDVSPEGLLYRVQPTSTESLAHAAGERRSVRQRLDQRLGGDRAEAETQRQLLWSDYVAALLFASRGERTLALQLVEQALVRSPGTSELERMRAALVSSSHAPLDVRTFLPERAR